MDVTCLQCLKSFPWSSYVYRNANGEVTQQLRNKPESLLAQLVDRLRGVRWADTTERAAILRDGYQMNCPDGHWVPADLRENRTIVIGVIGPPGASKSHYLATAIGQLLQVGLTDFMVTVNLHSWSNDHFHTAYMRPVWRERLALPKSPPMEIRTTSNPPIALSVRELTGGRKWNLIFFDSAGEDVMGSEAQAKHALYLFNASALIFLVEPTSIPGLEETLGMGDFLGSAAGIVNSTAEALRDVKGMPSGHRFDDLPVAVVVGKSDLLDGYQGMPAQLVDHPEDGGLFQPPSDLSSIHKRSRAITDFLDDHRATPLCLTVLQAFEKHTFHLASATGCRAEPGPPPRFPELRPRRCLDPIVALLADLNVLSDEGRRQR